MRFRVVEQDIRSIDVKNTVVAHCIAADLGWGSGVAPVIIREMFDAERKCRYRCSIDPDGVDRTRRFKWQAGEVVVNFGKNAGRPLKEIAEQDPGFLRWIVRSDFPDDVKQIASDALIGKFPVRKA